MARKTTPKNDGGIDIEAIKAALGPRVKSTTTAGTSDRIQALKEEAVAQKALIGKMREVEDPKERRALINSKTSWIKINKNDTFRLKIGRAAYPWYNDDKEKFFPASNLDELEQKLDNIMLLITHDPKLQEAIKSYKPKSNKPKQK